jgi:uncharacterized protein (TIGR03382 family)
MYHFAVPRLGTGDYDSTLREHIHTIDGRRYLRIAQNRTTRWIGEGPTTGTAAANNFNGVGGIPFTQYSPGYPPSPTTQNNSLQDIVLFKFKIRLDPSLTNRELFADLPLAGFGRNASTGGREAGWFTTPNHIGGQYLHANVENHGSLINVIGPVPSPAALPFLALSAAAVTLRRRR